MTGTKEQIGTTTPTPALIDHILTSYHEAHRRDLPNLIELSQRVETVHANDPNAPHGLSEALKSLLRDLEEHMSREESVVFFALNARLMGGSEASLAVLRLDHDRQEAEMDKIAAITHGFWLPAYACRSWTQLYSGLRKLVEDLNEHMILENNLLFPRFENRA